MEKGKRVTSQELKQLYYLNRELSMWQTELDKLRCKSLIGSPQWDKPPCYGGGTSDKVGDRAVAEADIIAIIEGKKAEINLKKAGILTYIANIDDSLTRQIFYYRHVACKSWAAVAQAIGGGNTQASVKMAYKRYLKQI